VLFEHPVTTTDELARAMVNVANHSAPRQLVEIRVIASFAAR